MAAPVTLRCPVCGSADHTQIEHTIMVCDGCSEMLVASDLVPKATRATVRRYVQAYGLNPHDYIPPRRRMFRLFRSR